jgi:hypothetical protein
MFWKFVCTKITEAECFQRRLLGDTKSFWAEVKKVKEGDILFLYNLDTDVLFGPFIAEGGGKLNIEPDAWGGKFPSQVRVNWKMLSAISDASKIFPFIRDKRLNLDSMEGRQIMDLLTEDRIKIPLKLKENIQRLDEEIHSLAHRIEEVMMTGKGHLADRQVELDRLKGEFYCKMRDFVWAIRKLDKRTNIFNLPSNK